MRSWSPYSERVSHFPQHQNQCLPPPPPGPPCSLTVPSGNQWRLLGPTPRRCVTLGAVIAGCQHLRPSVRYEVYLPTCLAGCVTGEMAGSVPRRGRCTYLFHSALHRDSNFSDSKWRHCGRGTTLRTAWWPTPHANCSSNAPPRGQLEPAISFPDHSKARVSSRRPASPRKDLGFCRISMTRARSWLGAVTEQWRSRSHAHGFL